MTTKTKYTPSQTSWHKIVMKSANLSLKEAQQIVTYLEDNNIVDWSETTEKDFIKDVHMFIDDMREENK